MNKECTPYVQNIEALEHQQGEQDDAFPKAYGEGRPGEGRVEMTSQLVSNVGIRSCGLRKLYEFLPPISGVNIIILRGGVQQLMVEISQQVPPATEEQSNSGSRGLMITPKHPSCVLSPQ